MNAPCRYCPETPSREIRRCRFCGWETTLDNLYEFTPAHMTGPLYHCRDGRACIARESDCPSSADDAADELFEANDEVMDYPDDPDSTEDTPSRQSPSTRTDEPIEGQQGTVTL